MGPVPRHSAGRVLDLHAHPSLKTYFTGRTLQHHQRARAGLAPHRLRSSYPSMRAGGVGALCSSVYVPERRLRSDCWPLAVAAVFLPRLRAPLRGDDPFRLANLVLDHVEREVARVNGAEGKTLLQVVRSNRELDGVEAAGSMALLHAFEGAHVLNGDVANVRRFQARGVCSITLAHFYDNGIAPPVDAIPHDLFLRRLGCFRARHDLDRGLTRLGFEVVEEMLEAGVLVDLTHSTPRARQDAYAMPNPRGRPMVMSHVGMATLFPAPLNASPADVRAIADLGGVVGIILDEYWLTGTRVGNALEHVVRHVRELTRLGGEACVAVGSDFDGMTDPPDGLREPAGWPRLRRALLSDGFSPVQVERFLAGNARRVLRDGWI